MVCRDSGSNASRVLSLLTPRSSVWLQIPPSSSSSLSPNEACQLLELPQNPLLMLSNGPSHWVCTSSVPDYFWCWPCVWVKRIRDIPAHHGQVLDHAQSAGACSRVRADQPASWVCEAVRDIVGCGLIEKCRADLFQAHQGRRWPWARWYAVHIFS